MLAPSRLPPADIATWTWPAQLEFQDHNLLTGVLAHEEAFVAPDPAHMADLAGELVLQQHRRLIEALDAHQFLVLDTLTGEDGLDERKPHMGRRVNHVHDAQKPMLG